MARFLPNARLVPLIAALVAPTLVPGAAASPTCPEADLLVPDANDVVLAAGVGAVGVGYQIHLCNLVYFSLVLRSSFVGDLAAEAWAPPCTGPYAHQTFQQAWTLAASYAGPATVVLDARACDGTFFHDEVPIVLVALALPRV
ncbi:MAG TPA: hypothetical protein VGR28_14455 [Candidatus Thermoplasmatota archaeon]|jgi:hypothetical protein|nr:hypothetical protein [Candidatus Thermoplasmatota archaeon]